MSLAIKIVEKRHSFRRWVHLLKKQGLSVAVLKHHGHGSPLDMPDSTTDTMQFFASGADVSVVAGGGMRSITYE